MRTLFIPTWLIAECTLTIVIERKLVEAVINIREQERCIPTPGRGKVRRDAHARHQFVPRVGRAIECDVFPESIAAVLVYGKADHQLLRILGAQRPANGDTALPQCIRANCRLQLTGPERCRRLSDETDQTTRCICPKRAGLRPAQNLDLA